MIFKKNGNIVETLGDIRLFVEATDLGGTRQLRLTTEGRMYLLHCQPAGASGP